MNSFFCGFFAAYLACASFHLAADPVESLYDLKVNSLDGKPVDLAQYKGQVVLVVNVASESGFTPQYAGLEKLYLTYKDKGFSIFGFPSNDFRNLEPGTPQEIAACANSYHVTFPMFEKVVTVAGPNQSSVYQFLSTGFPPPAFTFCKFLVDRNGKVLQQFTSKVSPENKKLKAAIEAALKK